MPDFALEKRFAGIVCGIDEAGRGPLAGPVVAAAVILDRRRLPTSLRDGLDDSKKLAPEAREEFFLILRRSAVAIGVGAASVAEIDRINILRATLVAMCRAVAALRMTPAVALVDGNVPPPLAVRGRDRRRRRRALAVDRRRLDHRQGDARPPHAAARRALSRLWLGRPMSATAPSEHRAALRALGPTPHHRLSFAPVQLGFDFDCAGTL